MIAPRFGQLLPNGAIDLDTVLNTELVQEVIAVIHTTSDKNVDLLVKVLTAEAKEEPAPGNAIPEAQGDATAGVPEHGMAGAPEEEGERGREARQGGVTRGRRYLSLRNVLRFSFQHPPLFFPVVQFQRFLRSKIIGETQTCSVVRYVPNALCRRHQLFSFHVLPGARQDLLRPRLKQRARRAHKP